MTMTTARNARAEADTILGDGYRGRVLEPSPPAVSDEFFADDPTNVDVGSGIVVGPTKGDRTWAEHVEANPALAPWAADRFLAGLDPLPSPPADLVDQRIALHRLATYVIAPARHQANGKFGLRWTKGGFGTPFFGADKQVRVEGGQLIVQEGDEAKSTDITSLQAAADFIGSKIDEEVAAEHDSPAMGDLDDDLGISAETATFLGRWWGFGTAALEQVRSDEESVDPSRVQMWPGHFDPAMEVGDENRRASYGASPGDAGLPEPYLYVSAWWPDRLDLESGTRGDSDEPFWNAEGYTGAILPLSTLVKADDQFEAAIAFFRQGRDRLAQAPNADA